MLRLNGVDPKSVIDISSSFNKRIGIKKLCLIIIGISNIKITNFF